MVLSELLKKSVLTALYQNPFNYKKCNPDIIKTLTTDLKNIMKFIDLIKDENCFYKILCTHILEAA